MEGEKKITYNLELTSSDVNRVIAELSTIFKHVPSLAGVSPNLVQFATMLNRMLSSHDYNKEVVEKIQQDMVKAGLVEGLLKDLQPSAEAAAPKKSSKKKAVEESGQV